jgi:uncharacterized delta-60 repeat protein
VKDWNSYSDYVQSITLQPNGEIVVAGVAEGAGNNSYFALMRLSLSGEIDFPQMTDFPNTTDDYGFAAKVQINGRIVTAGFAGNSGYTTDTSALTCHLDTGYPDTSFGNNGMVTTDLSSNSFEEFEEILLLQGGKLLAVGTSANSSGVTGFTVVRYFGCGF